MEFGWAKWHGGYNQKHTLLGMRLKDLLSHQDCSNDISYANEKK